MALPMSNLLQLLLLVVAGAISVSASALVPPLEASAFSVYSGYTGNLAVSGSVQVGQEGHGTQVIFFDLVGADPQCNSTADIAGVANACGIHVHTGLSCEDAGGHYYDNASILEDPWKPVRYTTEGVTGTASEQNVRVLTGRSLADVEGRTMVIHDITGARVACALLDARPIQNDTLQVQEFVKYPGYTGSLTVHGSMSIEQIGTGAGASQVLGFSLTGADPTCGTANISGVSNACGIHVHEGTTCKVASSIGGHFYAENLESDPWKPIMYSTSAGVSTGVTVMIKTGLTNGVIRGRVMVVHDAAGARIACGQIGNETQGQGGFLSGALVNALSSSLAFALLLAHML